MFLKQVDMEENTITYTDNETSCSKIIYPVYSENSEMTFIMCDITEKDILTSTEISGFYYGKPDLELMEQYIGNLKAVF